MATFRTRNGVVQAIVRVKKGGEIVHQESRSFKGDRAAKLAKDWAAKLEATIKLNGVPARELSVATLGGLLLRYRQTRNAIRPLRRQLDHELVFLASEFEKDSLAKLTSERFTRYARRRHEAGTGPTTLLHNLATIRAALNAAKPMFGLDIDGRVVADAIAALDKLGVVSRSQERDRRPTERELELLRAEFERTAGHPSTEIPMRVILDLAIVLPRPRYLYFDQRFPHDDIVEQIIAADAVKNDDRMDIIANCTDEDPCIYCLRAYQERLDVILTLGLDPKLAGRP